MLGSGLGRAVGLSARRIVAPPTVARAIRAPVTQNWAAGRPLARSLNTAPWQRFAALSTTKYAAAKAAPQVVPAAKTVTAKVAAPSEVLATATASVNGIRQSGMILELGLTFTLVHYQHIFQSVMRGLFQSFRPLIILYVFSHIFKAMFFLLGAPVWFSFYSFWLFEICYNLFQCFLGFMFIGMYYNNLYFARVRPTMAAMFRQQRQRLARVARMVTGAM